MNAVTPADLLRRAHALVARGPCRLARALTVHGSPTGPTRRDAVRWSLDGALIRATAEAFRIGSGEVYFVAAYKEAQAALVRAVEQRRPQHRRHGPFLLIEYQDAPETPHAAVLGLIEAAIAALEGGDA